MDGHTKRRIAGALFPRYSLSLDKINHNARFKAWLKDTARTVPVVPHRFDLYKLIQSEHIKSSPIDYIEFGVYKGASICLWTELSRNPESRFWGFDSFEGLPEAWGGVEAGSFNMHGEPPATITDQRVQLIKGWFQDTLPGFLRSFQPRSRLVVHLDCDLYSSALFCLTQMDSVMTTGTIIIFDEFCSALHEFRAFRDYSAAYRRQERPLVMTRDYAEQTAFMFE